MSPIAARNDAAQITGQVAGAATEKHGLEAHRPKRPAHTAFSQESPCPDHDKYAATTGTPCRAFSCPENQRPAASPQALPVRRHCDHVRVEGLAVASGATQRRQHAPMGVEPDDRFRAAGVRGRSPANCHGSARRRFGGPMLASAWVQTAWASRSLTARLLCSRRGGGFRTELYVSGGRGRRGRLDGLAKPS
jgi:hypothetical protein